MPAHSFTSIKQFRLCPKQYEVSRVLRLYPYKQTPEAEFGDRAHKAIAMAGVHGTPLPAEFAAYQWILDSLIPQLPPVRLFEQEFNFNAGWRACGAKDWQAKRWTGAADLLAVSEDRKQAVVIDWKTGGSRYPDAEQLELMALFTMTGYPTVDYVRGVLLFLQDGKVESRDYTRQQVPALLAKWEQYGLDVDMAIKSSTFPAVKNNLCPWCPHKSCPNWTPPPEKRK